MADERDELNLARPRFWTKLFVVVVTITLGVQVYLFLAFRHEIQERRYQFCVAENVSNQRQVDLWEFVIRLSVPDAGETAEERANQKDRTKRFRSFLARSYPMRDCDEF